MKQASRDDGSMRGCAHRDLESRPASVEPPRMRVGQNPARGTVALMSRRSASSAHAKRPLSMEGSPGRGSRCCSRGSGRSDLGGSHSGGPTRRRASWSNQNRSERGDRGVRRSVATAASAENIPGTVASLEREAIAARRSGETGVRVHPLPRKRGGSQSPSPRARRKSRGRTGNQRVRVFVSRDLGSRHRTNASVRGACPAGRCKASRRERCLARRKPIPGWEIILTTRVGGERAKTVRRFSAVANSGFRERVGLVG